MNNVKYVQNKIIEYYNKNKFQNFDLNKISKTIEVPLKYVLHSYNYLQQHGLLITIDNDRQQSIIVMALEHPINDIKNFLLMNRKFILECSNKLNVLVSQIVFEFCYASGIMDKKICWCISDWFINEIN